VEGALFELRYLSVFKYYGNAIEDGGAHVPVTVDAAVELLELPAP
jgi:hypothetical protein